ncbi:c6 transcription factor [Diplodia corticola]|uniref:C6 transcription factor n=1 Tax=Diplodia corticola TaxID=236234 RepID=A0A1J9QR79_9PEZI|nr:c6 transcription factor [Diplodia corticola]OJD30921.1 c6 transcription factor [Diplodia corticola]
MTPTPPSTTSSNSGQSPDGQFRVVRKRNRVPLSCAPCRHRKLKCNRGHPCDNCTKRGDNASCTYATPGSRKKNSSTHSAMTSPDDMQNRIDRLEGLVLSLMTNGSQSAGPAAAAAAIANMNASSNSQSHQGSISGSSTTMDQIDVDAPEPIKEEQGGTAHEDSDVEQVAKSIGVMKVDNNKTIFASEAHWYAILGEIAEVKTYFNDHKKQYEEQLRRHQTAYTDDISPGTAFLFGSVQPAERAELMAAFPAKVVADLLITRYFNVYDPGFHIIHGPTFQKQYDQHWLNPDETPVIWLGMAYAMMCIALQSYHRAGDEPPEYRGKTWDMSSEYRRRCAQCLLRADITTPVANTLETLILHVQAEYARSRDAEVGVLVSWTIIVRLAMRMGYHRDPAPYRALSPFNGEMRRRVWCVVRKMDLLFSHQMGQPPMIRATDTSAELPRNIYDDELFEEMKSLPPSRPMTEATPCSYMIAKSRLVYGFSEVVEKSQVLSCTSYDGITKLDQRLREIHAETPPHLQLRSMEESARDPATLIMQRFSLELLYLKSQIVLHKKFLGPSRENARYAYSRRTCIDASMAMLRHQATIHHESQPNGRLRTVKWFITSLTMNDFLVAAMVVALDLYHISEADRAGRSTAGDLYGWSHNRRDEMFAAVERAIPIWRELQNGSMEAYKAHTALIVMVNTLKSNQSSRAQDFATAAAAYPATASIQDDANVAPEHSAAMTLGMLSTGALTPNSSNMFDNRPSFPASMGNILNDPLPAVSSGTGLTPQYTGPSSGGENGGPISAASPFSQMFGASNMSLQGMDVPSTNLDWDAWDSYVQGTAMDPSNPMWPMGMPDLMSDASAMPQQPQQQSPTSSQPQQQQPVNTAFMGGGSVFMGNGTPERNTMM